MYAKIKIIIDFELGEPLVSIVKLTFNFSVES